MNYLEEKPEDEPLDSRWLDIWGMYNRYASRYVSLSVIEKIEENFLTIKPIDEEIWEIQVNNDIKVTFLLGAGTSAPSGIPTVDKLLSELRKRARKIGREDLDRLAKWCSS